MRKFGLIGYPLSHSFSQRYFTEKFEREGIADASYSVYPLAQIGELTALFGDPELCGLNVTIPYKEQVLPFLDGRNEVVQEINACNCIRIEKGKRVGYNTDVVGFRESLLKKLQPHHEQALILGTGGASKAVEYVIKKLGISYRFVSRRPRPSTTDLSYEQVDASLLRSCTLLVNTTPLGMYPKTEDCPPLPYEAIGSRHYLFDLVYNPEKTSFLQKGEERGAVIENGYEMLILQAEESWRIWNA
ncbi:MAG TPA: shikimate dehydrogenase [Puia sp.]